MQVNHQDFSHGNPSQVWNFADHQHPGFHDRVAQEARVQA
jgi:hypothetical protein